MAKDLTPKDFKIIPLKKKILPDEGSEILGGRIGGPGSTPVSDIDKVIDEDGKVDAGQIGGEIPPTNLDIASRGWLQDCSFSVTDVDTIAWAGGTLTAADGTAYSIDAGNTGDMSAKTFIYFDIGASETVYQTTTTITDAVGAGKVLIAVAESGTNEASVFIFSEGVGNMPGGKIELKSIDTTEIADDAITTPKIRANAVTANEIFGNTITANEIAANTITADEILANTITAVEIAANTITANELSTSIVYAGTIIIDTGGAIRSGQTAFDTGTGWWLGDDGGTPKFSIGDSDNFFTWDGKIFKLQGIMQSGSSSAQGWLGDESTIIVSGSGVVTKSLLDTSVATGTTPSSKATIYSTVSTVGMLGSFLNSETLNAGIRLQLSALYYSGITPGSGPISFIGLSNVVPATTSSTSFTVHHIGWYVEFQASGGPKIYATNADGTTQTITDTGVVVSNNIPTILRIEKLSSTVVNFYIDNVLEVTHTTNISTSNAAFFVTASCANNAIAAESGLGIGNYVLVTI